MGRRQKRWRYRRNAFLAQIAGSASSLALQLIVGQLLNGIFVGRLDGIIALGVTLTFGITGIVNFALGAFMAIGAYLCWYFTDEIGISYPLAATLAVQGTALCGLVADQSLFRFTRNNLIMVLSSRLD